MPGLDPDIHPNKAAGEARWAKPAVFIFN